MAAPVPSTGYSWGATLAQNNRTLTYSFDHTGGYEAGGHQTISLDSLFAGIPRWEDVIKEALNEWSAAAGITFVEVPDSGDAFGAAGAQGIIRFAAYPLPQFAAAMGQVPPPTSKTEETHGFTVPGDIAFSPVQAWDAPSLKSTVSHELGHALGIIGHNMNPESIMYGWAGEDVSAPSEHDLADIRAIYFPQNAPASVLAEQEIAGVRDWFAVADGTAAAPAKVTITGSGRILATGEQKTGIKGIGDALADENYGFDHVILHLAAGGRIETDGHNAYGIGVGDHNAITLDGVITTAGFSADGIAVMGQENRLHTGTTSLIRTSGAGGNGIFIGGGFDEFGFYGNEVVAAGRIETRGAGGAGIFVAGYSSVTLDGSIATSGAHAPGIASDQHGHLNIIVSQTGVMETGGDSGHGILIRGPDNVVAMSGTIVTSGIESAGIFATGVLGNDIVSRGSIATSGETARGVFVRGDHNHVASSGAIATTGESAHGLYVTGAGNQLENPGSISTTGVAAHGMRAYGSDNQLLNSGTITTTGEKGYGLSASGSANRIENLSAISTTGTQGYALYASGSGNQLLNSGAITTTASFGWGILASGSNNRIENLSTISTTGTQGYALYAPGSGNELLNSGAITNAGEMGYGLFAFGSGNRLHNSGRIVTSGPLGHGIVAAEGGNVLVHSGIIDTSGDAAFGVFVRSGDNAIDLSGDIVSRRAEAVRIGGFWNNDARAIEETDATGNRLLLHGSPQIGGDIVNDGADNGSTVYFGIALNATSPAGYAVAPTDLTYSGSFRGRQWQGEIISGSVRLNGSLNEFSTLTVHAGATFGGATTLTGDLVNRGRVAPGDRIGTIAVGGDYQQPTGAILQMDIGGAQSDRLTVAGDATFANGSLLELDLVPLIRGGDYPLVSVGGALSGLPSSNLDDSALLRFRLNSGAAALTLAVDRTAYADIAVSENQRALGAALDRLLPVAAGELADVLVSFDGLAQAGDVRQTLDALTPASYAALPDAALFTARRFVGALPSPESVAADNGTNWTAHAGVLPLEARRKARDGIAGYRIDGSGFTAGVDRRTAGLLLGAAMSYQETRIDHDNRTARTESDSLMGVLRAVGSRDDWHVRGHVGFGRHSDESHRELRAPTLARQARSSNRSDLVFAGVEAGRSFEPGQLTLTPFAGLDYAAAFWGGFNERGADVLDVQVKSTTTESLRSVLGVIVAAPFNLGEALRLHTRLRLAWSHEFADTFTSYHARMAGETFTVRGRHPGRDLLSAGVEVQAALGRNVSATLGFDCERQREDYGQAAKAWITCAF